MLTPAVFPATTAPLFRPSGPANRAGRLRHSLAALGLGALVSLAQATTLYDPTQISQPSAQGWSYTALGPASQNLSGGLAVLDTTGLAATHAGYYRSDLAVDSSGAGSTLSFAAQLSSETHTSNDRAGFSLILLDTQHQGIELSFWSGSIWAESAPGFTHAEEASWTTGNLTDYALNLSTGTYSLWAGGSLLLSGAMRDYSSFGAPYATANFIFLGDNTSSGKARVGLGSIALASAVPEPAPLALMLSGWVALGLARRLRPEAGQQGRVLTQRPPRR